MTFEEVQIGWLGELHPRLQQKYDLPVAPVLFEIDCDVLLAGRAPRFTGVSRMPTVRRDLAVVVDETLSAGAILEAVRASVPACVREVEVFDQYRGKGVENGRKSLAFRIVMQDTARTLTDAQVEEIVGSIRHLLVEKFKALPRT
jgi:phenylalanyl-tRNA synthetase beta chain